MRYVLNQNGCSLLRKTEKVSKMETSRKKRPSGKGFTKPMQIAGSQSQTNDDSSVIAAASSSKKTHNSKRSETATFPQSLYGLYTRTIGKNPVIIALHSFKGGTGKTALSINLATIFAKMGRKVCLMELDFNAPSFFATFNNSGKHWVNDYLNKACKAERLLIDCGTENMGKGKLFVGLANPSTEAIRELASKDRKWEIEALGRLLSLKDALTNGMQFDYVFFDTGPGLLYSSINAIIAAAIVLVVSSTDKSDVEGTRRMIHDLYEIFQKKPPSSQTKYPLIVFLQRRLTDINHAC
jgi:cellulose biosynthesis protein BcsQ